MDHDVTNDSQIYASNRHGIAGCRGSGLWVLAPVTVSACRGTFSSLGLCRHAHLMGVVLLRNSELDWMQREARVHDTVTNLMTGTRLLAIIRSAAVNVLQCAPVLCCHWQRGPFCMQSSHAVGDCSQTARIIFVGSDSVDTSGLH
jgi:hypothetical protein